jgi:hypothetical protein
MIKSTKKSKIAIDKTNNFCYNDIMKNKGNKMIEKVVTTNGFTFTYNPSLKVLGVTHFTWANGKWETFHQINEQKANEKVGEILEKHRNRA